MTCFFVGLVSNFYFLLFITSLYTVCMAIHLLFCIQTVTLGTDAAPSSDQGLLTCVLVLVYYFLFGEKLKRNVMIVL